MLGSLSSYSQNAIAKIKYEDAELDFSNQNYAKALVTLTEVETILGRKTPKISHFKSVANQYYSRLIIFLQLNFYFIILSFKHILHETNFGKLNNNILR